MTIAAIDRLIHHSVVVEMNVESYRRRAATMRKGRTPPKTSPEVQAQPETTA